MKFKKSSKQEWNRIICDWNKANIY